MATGNLDVEAVRGPRALAILDGGLDALPVPALTPFLTPQWLRAWWEVFGRRQPLALVVRRDGHAVAGAFCLQSRALLAATANDHSGDWDLFGTDRQGRDAVWARLAQMGALRVRLAGLAEWTGGADEAAGALRKEGYRVVTERGPLSPYLHLPESSAALLAAQSRNLRSQVGRRRRGLEREGELVLRTSTDELSVARDLDAFLHLEASGWKGRSGTAIAADPSTERLYRSFALAAARAGIVRLHLLEVGGTAVAGDLAIVLGRTEFLIKTGYDEARSHLSPGLVLRGEVLRRAIEEEALEAYDFLGGPDAWKLRWTSEVRARVTVFAYRDPPGYWYRKAVRPRLKGVVAGMRERRP